jgi:predicted  nucleic acid-binding Zn-ribbon protein
MKRRTLKDLQHQIDAFIYGEGEQRETHRKEMEAQQERYSAMRVERDKFKQREEKTREQFEDLKKRLLEAETEQARLRGYLSRVHEDDIVRDGMVEIEDSQGKRMVPKRTPPLLSNVYDSYDTGLGGLAYSNEKKTHWTSY